MKHLSLEGLIDKAVKNIREAQVLGRPGDTKMLRLWLEKMYIKGNLNALKEMEKKV